MTSRCLTGERAYMTCMNCMCFSLGLGPSPVGLTVAGGLVWVAGGLFGAIIKQRGRKSPVSRKTLDDGGCNGSRILGDRRNQGQSIQPVPYHQACGGKGLGLASPLVTTSSSSTMEGLLRSIDSLANSPSSGSSCRVFPNPPRLEIRHWG